MQDTPDTAEFLARIEAHQNIIFKVSFVYGRQPADREDLVQEILLQVWRSFDSFDGRSAFATWMYRVALNTAITFRKRTKTPPQSDDEAWVHGTQYEEAELSDDLKTLYRAISRLTPVEKAIVMLWLDERSYEEIADTVGMSVKNVSVRLVRIRKQLARLIREAEQP